MKIAKVTAALLGLALSGCSIFGGSSTKSTEDLLTAAGFKLKLADTPEREAHLKTLPQRTVFPREQDGTVYYFFADAKQDRLYRGTQEAYQSYQLELQAQKEDALDQELSEKEHDDAVLNAATMGGWEVWEVWDP
ncbi:MAG TPA: hypothetical protein PLI51_09110 [bacterium]|mgnify:FL=1|nr:hypothetical protein [bacterium]HPQ66872.1 hypothetical protein [bacterium]